MYYLEFLPHCLKCIFHFRLNKNYILQTFIKYYMALFIIWHYIILFFLRNCDGYYLVRLITHTAMCSVQMFVLFGVLIRSDSLLLSSSPQALGFYWRQCSVLPHWTTAASVCLSSTHTHANVISRSLGLSFSFSLTGSLWRKADRHKELLYFYSSL